MTTKSEDEIAREKEAVQKMVGAKSAMETAINRIARLEAELKYSALVIEDVAKAVGPTLFYRTFHAVNSSPTSEAKFCSVEVNLRDLGNKIRGVL